MDAESLLGKLVGINSVFGSEKAIGEFLESYLRRIGFNTFRQNFGDGRYNIFAERGDTTKTLLFYGHMDTVTIHGSWKHGPLRLSKEGDKLYGLGACDMKGGIAAMLTAIEANKNRGIKVLFCGDEENISQGAWKAIEMKKWFEGVKFIVSCEPGDSKKHTGGANVITIGRRGRVVIQVDITGRSAHGANPQNGINAIYEAAKIALGTRLFELRNHPKLGKENIFVRNIYGSSASALDLPDKAHIELDIQLVPPSTTMDALKRSNNMISHLRRTGAIIPGTEVEVRIKERKTPYIDPYVESTSNPAIRRLLGIVNKCSARPIINYGSSVADDNILSNSLHKPIVTIGPRGGNEHAPEEWVSSSSLMELAKLYGEIIVKM